MATSTVYGSSQARDWIWATTAIYATASTMLDPLTHWARLGIKPLPLQQESCCNLILILLCHSENSKTAWFFFFFFFFFEFMAWGCSLGQESNPWHSSNQSHSSEDGGSLTHCTTKELPFPIFKLGYLSFYCWVIIILYIFRILDIRHMICKYCLPLYRLFFRFLDGILWSTKVFNFYDIRFIIIFWLLMLCMSRLRNHHPIQGQRASSLYFLLTVLKFYLWHLGLWSSWLNFNLGLQMHSFACRYPIIPASVVEKIIISSLNCPGTFAENQWSINI